MSFIDIDAIVVVEILQLLYFLWWGVILHAYWPHSDTPCPMTAIKYSVAQRNITFGNVLDVLADKPVMVPKMSSKIMRKFICSLLCT